MQYLHGTPAKVIRKIDNKEYMVTQVYFDGDRHGYVVTIFTVQGDWNLYPGDYRTTARYFWDWDKKQLDVQDLQ